MSNKQIIKEVFDNKFNTNKIRDQILLKNERKRKNIMIKFFKYAIPIIVIVFVISLVLFSNKQLYFKYSDGNLDIIVNKIDDIDLTKLDVDIKLEEINSVNLPWFEMFDDINIPKDIDKFYGYIVYSKNNSSNDYNVLDSYVYEYFNLDSNRKIKIAFSNTNKPIRDYFFDIDDAKESNINDNKLIIYQREDIYFTEFKYNGYYFDIETSSISFNELITFLKSIIK